MTETQPEKRLIGYARVSTYGQTLDSQLEQLRVAGCSRRNIYREKATGARPDRRELNKMLDTLEYSSMPRNGGLILANTSGASCRREMTRVLRLIVVKY